MSGVRPTDAVEGPVEGPVGGDDPEVLAAIAVDVARDAAAFVRRGRPVGRVEVAATKSSPTDVVTELDRATERRLRERIAAVRPGDGFLGEEDGAVAGTTDVRWVCDPIDGTVNFVYGLPAYAVSVAAEVAGEVVAGCVVNVATGEEFSAALGAGATVAPGPDAPRRVLGAVAPPSLAHALVGTGFSYVRETRLAQAEAVTRLLAEVRDVRRIGSAALDLCGLADGRLDAYVESGLKPWDLAAGGLVARESGVVLAGLDGDADERLTMAAPKAVAQDFFDVVRRCRF